MVEGARTVLSALYFRLIVPVLQLLLNNVVAKGIVGMFQSVWLFVAWVLSLFARQSVARSDLYESSADSLRNAMEDSAAPLVNGPQILAVLGGILAAAVLVFVLYRLIRRKKEAPRPKRRQWSGVRSHRALAAGRGFSSAQAPASGGSTAPISRIVRRTA